MKTLIELYSPSPIKNIYSTLLLRPERVIFIGGREMKQEHVKRFIKRKHPEIKTEFHTVDIRDLDSISQALDEILLKHPESVVELNGGGDLMHIAVGKVIAEQDVPAFFCDIKNQKLRNVSKFEITEEMRQLTFPQLSLEDFVLMAGGSLEGHGHINLDKISGEMERDIDFLWSVFFKKQDKWRRLVDYLQNRRNSLRTTSGALVLHERLVYNEFISEMLSGLASSPGKIIRELNSSHKQISFSYKNEILKKCLNNKGLILELYLYNLAFRMGYFEEVKISTIIDWNGIGNEENNISNEVDIALVKGTRPIFISCKLKIITVEDLNEIDMLVKRFGGECGIGVVATAGTFSKDFPTVYRRAQEMGIYVIEHDDFKYNRVEEKLEGLK